MKYLSVLLPILFALHAIAQDFKPLASKGTIPEEFITKSSEKYIREKQNIDKTEQKKTKRTQSKFFLQSAFSTDNILKSGYVLFHDSVTAYVNKVAQEMLKANPQVQASNLRFYTLKSTVVNAISNNDGLILVNLGLIAQLENEAQLAFILCHEISHYLEKHAINNFIEVQRISKGKGVYKELSFDERVVEKLKYSKENEEEADKKGFELFANTKYAYSALDGAFDVLKYAYLPIDNIPFNYSLLESENLRFPDDFKIAEVNAINTEEDEDDEESTHPAVSKRRKRIAASITGKSDEGRVKFIFPENEFKAIRQLARYEMMRLLVLNTRYESAVYHASVLLTEKPGDRYVEEALGRALYGMAFYCGGNDFSDIHKSPSQTEGYLHQVVFLFDKLDDKNEAAGVTALRYMLWLKKKYPDGKHYDFYIDGLVKLLVKDHEMEWDFFASETLADLAKKQQQALLDTVKKEEDGLSKYEKIKKQTETAALTDVNYVQYALADYKNDIGLEDIFDKYEKENEAEETRSGKEKNLNKRKGYALNIGKVTMFDPIYAFVDQRKKESYRYLESEHGQEKLTDQIESIAKKTGLDAPVLSMDRMLAQNVMDYNDYAFISEYVNEQFNHADGINVSTVERYRIDDFVSRYGSPYIDLMALIHVKRTTYLGSLIAYSVVFPFILPFTIPRMISMKRNCYYLNMLYNLETGELVFNTTANINASDHNYLVKTHVYNSFRQIKASRK